MMGLFEKACQTYDYHTDLVGISEVGKEPLSPCSHRISSADLEITVDADGHFVSVSQRDKDAPKIVIPVTEKSNNRTGSSPAPHPLCDILRYLLPANEAHYQAYVSQLTQWTQSTFSHPKLLPILRYVEGKTICADLQASGLVPWENGKPKNDKMMICWRVVGIGDTYSGPCWTDSSLFEAFDAHYLELKKDEPAVLCMVTGKFLPPAPYHPKNIISSHANAKLISSKDDNFVFRGRFTDAEQAETVSYSASQKAHNTLHWLIANQNVHFGGRYFVCWEPQQLALPNPLSALALPGMPEPSPRMTPSAYQQDLQNTLNGWKCSLPTDSAQAVIASFDAATDGRLAVTYYSELQASDFLERLYHWDSICCWPNGNWGIQSPSLWQLVCCAYGTQQTGKNGKAQLHPDDKLAGQQVQRLLACRIAQSSLPLDLVQRLVQRAGNPVAFESAIWRKILFTTCAALRKLHYDRNKEVWPMALEPNKKDRSYQYGRMLAVLEKAENDTFDADEKRTPNAIRMMSVFAQRPQYAARIVWEQVKTAYYPRLNAARRVQYEKLLQEIFAELSQFESSELNRPLEDTYLMGYYLQKQALYLKKENEGV